MSTNDTTDHGPGHHVLVTVDPRRNHGRASITRGMVPICSPAGMLWAGDPVEVIREEFDLTEDEAAVVAALADDFHDLATGDHAGLTDAVVDQVAAVPGVTNRDAAKAVVRAVFESPLWRRTALEAHEASQQLRAVYRERAHLVALAASVWPSVIAYNDPAEPAWPVVYIASPEGQWSWHLSPEDLDLFGHVPQADSDDPRAQWDGHTTEEKYRRLAQLVGDGHKGRHA